MSHPVTFARLSARRPSTKSGSSVALRGPRRRVAASAAALAGVAAVAWAGSLVPVAAAVPAGGPPEAVDYVVSQLVDGNHVESGGFVQYGQTLDVAYGLAAAGGAPDTLDAVAAYMSSTDAVGAYTQGVPFDREEAAYAGATGKLGLAMRLLGVDPTDVGGVDLVAQLQSLEQPSGRFSDRSDFGDFSTVLGQSFGVLFLTAAEAVEPSAATVQFLLDAQCDDGGFPEQFSLPEDCASSPDATGLVIQALNADDPDEGADDLSPEHEAALVAAVRWLESTRDADGAWMAFGAQNVNATAYAAMGLLGVNQTAQLSVDWLASLQLPDGGLPISPGGDSDLFATAQALPPLVSTALITLDESVVAPMVTVPAAEPSPSPTETSTPTETPTQSPTSTPTETSTPTGSPTSTGSTPPETTGPGTPVPTLPPTGGGGMTVPLLGLALVLAGGGIMIAARRLTAQP